MDSFLSFAQVSDQRRADRRRLDQEWKSYWVRITRVEQPEIKVASSGNDANLIGALIHFQSMEQEHGKANKE